MPNENEPSTSDKPVPGTNYDDLVKAVLGDPIKPGDRIGPYTLISLIGEGGFGAVWRARQEQPVVRQVALKIIRPGMGSREVIERFEQERQILASIEHPNVAMLFDGSITPASMGSLPYFVMELVEGEPITTFCTRQKYDVTQCLGLFMQVCEAIEFVHKKGVIHRDLKPSNILVTTKGEQVIAKVIDFGIARAINREQAQKTVFQDTGKFIGTLEYMAPEQAGSVHQIDHLADVYSLGVILYELISGLTPFDGRVLRAMAYERIRQVLLNDDPPTPSKRFRSGVAAGELQTLQARQWRQELDWVPMKALRKDRTRRYVSADDLRADIQRFLNHEPLKAGPESAWYTLGKFVRRNRRLLTIAAAILLLATISVALAWRQWTGSFGAVTVSALAGGPGIATFTPSGASSRIVQDARVRIWELRGDRPSRIVSRIDSGDTSRLAPGRYRAVAVAPNGDFAERTFVIDRARTKSSLQLVIVPNATFGMVMIPAAEHELGYDDPRPNSLAARRKVKLDAFWIDVHQVSMKDYKAFTDATGHRAPAVWAGAYDTRWDGLPVVGVTNEDATAYSNWAGKRLPTMDEWEAAARYPDGRLVPWGDAPCPLKTWPADEGAAYINSDSPTGFRMFLNAATTVAAPDAGISGMGLRMLLGNVWEFTDTLIGGVQTPGGNVQAVVTVNGQVGLKGCPWHVAPGAWNLAKCMEQKPGTGSTDLGFRCAKSVSPVYSASDREK